MTVRWGRDEEDNPINMLGEGWNEDADGQPRKWIPQFYAEHDVYVMEEKFSLRIVWFYRGFDFSYTRTRKGI